MATEPVSLELEIRETRGKAVKRLRRSGIVPVHLYGPGMESRALQCEARPLERALARAGPNTAISLTIRGEEGEHRAVVREVQLDPVRGDIAHADFLAADKSA